MIEEEGVCIDEDVEEVVIVEEEDENVGDKDENVEEDIDDEDNDENDEDREDEEEVEIGIIEKVEKVELEDDEVEVVGENERKVKELEVELEEVVGKGWLKLWSKSDTDCVEDDDEEESSIRGISVWEVELVVGNKSIEFNGVVLEGLAAAIVWKLLGMVLFKPFKSSSALL